MLDIDKQKLEKDFYIFIKDKLISRKEKWIEVKDTFGTYKISNYGRLAHWSKINKWKILKQTNKKGGYFSVVLRLPNKNISKRIHRIVAETFIPNINNLPQVNHKDGDKQNNYIGNLEWCSSKSNFNHAKENKLWVYNEPYKHINNLPKLRICQFSLQGKYIKTYDNAKEASRETGVCSRNILQVANKEEFNKEKHLKRKQAGGFIWKKEINIKGGGCYENEHT